MIFCCGSVLCLLLVIASEVASQTRDLFTGDFTLDTPGASISAVGLFGCLLEVIPSVEIGGELLSKLDTIFLCALNRSMYVYL